MVACRVSRRYSAGTTGVHQSLDLVWTGSPTVRSGATTASARRLQVARGYRRMLVPVDARPESFGALEIACRLAADNHAKITAIAVIEVPALLPLDAHLSDEEDEARRLLERAGAMGDS